MRDPLAVAIDIGAWIGTTAIWLSHNFAHVVCVESDPVSLDFLERNLAASGCHNVTIVDRPISNVEQMVIFGPRREELNESMSCIKEQSDNPLDVTLRAITFDSLPLQDGLQIKFVKCDIEGGEELILEDLLRFCLAKGARAYVSFHLSWWKDQNIKRFADLFSRFSADVLDPIAYIQVRPFGSVLFTPR